MANIVCSVSNCANNNCGSCYAAGVNIGGRGASQCCETCCGSYVNKTSCSNAVVASSVPVSNVSCNANECKHNSSGMCSLDTLNVAQNSTAGYYTETECSSFEK